MDRERLYEILDIEEPAGFDYFENIAALLECDENIGYEELYGLLQEVDKETLSMLIDNYFEELSDFLPEDDADFYLKIDQIRRSLVGLAQSSDDENVLGSLAEELDRFLQMVCGRVPSHLQRSGNRQGGDPSAERCACPCPYGKT